MNFLYNNFTCITVTAPYVTIVQYREPMNIPPATNGQVLSINLSSGSIMDIKVPVKNKKNPSVEGDSRHYMRELNCIK